MSRTVVTLDESWTAKEIPVPLKVKMFKTDQNLTGWLLQLRMTRNGTELSFGGTVTWEDASTGIAKITFVDGDIDVETAGDEFAMYDIEVWASGGGQRLASVLIKNGCYAYVGSAPTV